MPADQAKLNLLMKAARNAGRLVYDHRQGEFLDVGNPGPWGVSLEGYCVAMSVEWCRRRLVNDDFAYDRAARKLVAPPVETLALHGRIASLGVEAVLPQLGLKRGRPQQCLFLRWNRLKGKMQPIDDSGLFVVTFDDHKTASGDPKHVIAFQMNGGTQRLFDPNFGQVLFDDAAKFDGFVEKFLDWGYAATGEYQSAYVLPVASRLWQGTRQSSVSALRKRFGG